MHTNLLGSLSINAISTLRYSILDQWTLDKQQQLTKATNSAIYVGNHGIFIKN